MKHPDPKKVRPFVAAIVIVSLSTWYAYDRWWGGGTLGGDMVLYGNVDIRQVALAFNVGGPIASVAVEEGTAVEKGQLLATLESEPYDHALSAAKATVALRQAELAKLVAGNRPQEIEQIRAGIAAAEADLANAESTYKRRQSLLANNDVSRQAYDDAQRALDAAKARLREQTEVLDIALEGFRKEDIAAARAALKAEEANLATARYRLARTELRAPAKGTVLIRTREPGAVVLSNTPVLTLALTDRVWVRTFIPETELGLVKPGLAAAVTTDSHPDRIFKGQVGFISPTAEFTPKAVETPELRTALVYRLRVYVDDPDNNLRQGMPVTLTLSPGGGE